MTLTPYSTVQLIMNVLRTMNKQSNNFYREDEKDSFLLRA